ncbi:MAG: phospho-N-acetylmuramoyl-pentapeptide-transferase [Candidatus Margulisbacteria bacterium]|nr:phospho-N-acetylmuramoyl-pentapeptide-transferase [Candidatus Margulisiibacteriota bacterium]
MLNSIAIWLSAAVLSLLLTFPVLRLLRLLKAGQTIRAEGPATHQAKTGTPTMGGVGFVLTILIMALILINVEFHPAYLALVLLTLAFALIGLADDLIKIYFRRNLGLTFWEKILLQTAAAGAFAIVLTWLGHNLGTVGIVPRLGLYQGLLYPFFVTFIIVGAANATNLTDGLNGLLAGTGTIAFLALAILALQLGQTDAATYALIAGGALFAFLYYNFPRAQLFMGDVGSLAVGAALGGLAVILREELRLALIGGLFVIEALSVIVQVGSYKLFKRRVLPMAPLHHTFELLGIKEWIVVVVFWAVAIVLAVAGVWI